jgi:hypothetical protein
MHIAQKPSFFFLIFLLCFPVYVYSQDSIPNRSMRPIYSKTTFLDHVYVGGTFSLQLGTISLIDLSPFVGYDFNKYLSAGFGGSYKYFRIIDHSVGVDQDGSIYGYRFFGKINVWENIFAYGEYESLSLETFSLNRREWVSNTFVGGGYGGPITDRVSSMLLLLFVVDYSSAQPLYTFMPVIRIGLTWRLGPHPMNNN